MMPPLFPFFRFPMSYNSYRNPYYNNFKHNMINSPMSSVPPNNNYKDNDDKISSDCTKSSSEQFFDIFGIHLYFDDILILCLLFFLYQEEVNDQFLFIALLLLLLS